MHNADNERTKRQYFAYLREARRPSESLQFDGEVGALRLNVYKRAELANSFKWRLMEQGIDKHLAAYLTDTLAIRLSINQLHR